MTIFVPAHRAVRATPFARRPALSLTGLATRSAPLPPSRQKLVQEDDQKSFPLLSMAWEVLLSDMSLPLFKARHVMVESMTAAQNCVIALSAKSKHIAQMRAQASVHGACLTISRCIDRAPAALRRKLDNQISALLKTSIVDTETIECIFDTAGQLFAEFPKHEASKAARKLIEPFDPTRHRWDDPHIGRYGALKDYEALSPVATCQIEIALDGLKKDANTELKASVAFRAIAETLTTDRSKRPDTRSSALIRDYVFAVAKIFVDADLSVARARNEHDAAYKSKFHRFSDIILAAMNEPRVRRHDGNLNKIAAKARKQHAKLPREDQATVSARLPRGDIQWLVSDDHIRAATRRFKFSP